MLGSYVMLMLMSDNIFDVWISSTKFWIDILSFFVILIYVNGGSLSVKSFSTVKNKADEFS